MSTVIFVSSSRENPEFEKKIQADLLSKWSGPIVSVTQKPTDFGKNICVGEVGASGFNFCRQVLIACEASSSPFCSSCRGRLPLFARLLRVCTWETGHSLPQYQHLRPEVWTGLCLQERILDFLPDCRAGVLHQEAKMLLEGQPMWNTQMKNFPKEIHKKYFEKFAYFETKYGCISFKTGAGMRKHSHSDEVPVYELPYWGSIKELRAKYV